MSKNEKKPKKKAVKRKVVKDIQGNEWTETQPPIASGMFEAMTDEQIEASIESRPIPQNYPALPDRKNILAVANHHDTDFDELWVENLNRFVDELLDPADAIREFERVLMIEAIEMVITIIGKNRDYGSSINEPPPLTPHLDAGVAMDVRLSDKIMRLITLSKQPVHIVSESIDDTKLDMAAYVLLQRTFRRLQATE